jgi:hypothetical protein
MPVDRGAGNAREVITMSRTVTIFRNSLISLAFAAAIPAAWAADAPAFSVPMQSAAAPPMPRLLDLKSPDIHDLMSADEIAAAIPNPDETEILGPEEVAVKGATPAPYVPGGFAALYWAATHPTDAWRILTPVE